MLCHRVGQVHDEVDVDGDVRQRHLQVQDDGGVGAGLDPDGLRGQLDGVTLLLAQGHALLEEELGATKRMGGKLRIYGKTKSCLQK